MKNEIKIDKTNSSEDIKNQYKVWQEKQESVINLNLLSMDSKSDSENEIIGFQVGKR